MDDLKKLINGTKLYFKTCLKIRDRETSTIKPFITNKSQDRLVKIVEDWKKQYPDETTRPTLYVIICKSRKQGFSTCTEAIFFKELHFSLGKVAMIVSYDADSATTINNMSDLFYQELPQFLKPAKRSSLSKGLLLENPKFDPSKPTSTNNDPGLQCKFLIETADNKNAGSSYTINYLHLSEVAKWPGNIKETMTSLLNSVPQTNSIVICESTSKGMNYFKSLWDDAVLRKNSYITLFVPWFDDEGYRMPYTGFELDDEEIRIKKEYNLDNDQLEWRRWAIKNKCSGDLDQFHQEYPACPEESFLSSGRPVFDMSKITRRLEYLRNEYDKKPPDVGYIDIVNGKYVFVPDKNGSLTIYEHPKVNRPYCIGADAAEGIRGGDYSVSQVCDNTTGNQVATQRSHIEPDRFAEEQIKLARYYNNALISNEQNNHGLTVIKHLQYLGYYNQYKRETYDEISQKRQQKFGFLTTVSTRPKLIDKTRAIVRDEAYLINDVATLQEMTTFIYAHSGKEEAEQGFHDDCVLSFAIMHEARSQQRAYSAPEPEKWDSTKYTHPSILIDSTKNPQLKRYYQKKYGRK